MFALELNQSGDSFYTLVFQGVPWRGPRPCIVIVVCYSAKCILCVFDCLLLSHKSVDAEKILICAFWISNELSVDVQLQVQSAVLITSAAVVTLTITQHLGRPDVWY